MLKSTVSKLFAAAMVALLPIQHASAADDDGNFGLRGIGVETCDSALAKLNESGDVALHSMSWLMGYISALNRMQAETFDVSPFVDGTAVMQLLVNTCSANPDIPVENAAFELFQALSPARVRSRSEIVTVTSDGVSMQLRQETLTSVQIQLRELGFLSGSADGVFGDQTRSALSAFQNDAGLQQTRLPDPVTVLRLLVPAAAPQ